MWPSFKEAVLLTELRVLLFERDGISMMGPYSSTCIGFLNIVSFFLVLLVCGVRILDFYFLVALFFPNESTVLLP